MNKYMLTVIYTCAEILTMKMYFYLNLPMKLLMKTLIRKWHTKLAHVMET